MNSDGFDADCLLAFGANLGDPDSTLLRVLHELKTVGFVTGSSSLFSTVPVGLPSGAPQFSNAAIRLKTGLSPTDLMGELMRIEKMFGRTRTPQVGTGCDPLSEPSPKNRRLDLDLLLFNDKVLKSPGLTIPHPRMVFRRFVLEPAAQIAPDMIEPVSGLSLNTLLAGLDASERQICVFRNEKNYFSSSMRQELKKAIRSLGCSFDDEASPNIEFCLRGDGDTAPPTRWVLVDSFASLKPHETKSNLVVVLAKDDPRDVLGPPPLDFAMTSFSADATIEQLANHLVTIHRSSLPLQTP